MKADPSPFISTIILAAGFSDRMGGADKLTEKIDGVAQLRRCADAALTSRAAETIIVLGPLDDTRTTPREAVLDGCGGNIVHNLQSVEGMASSLRAGLAAISPKSDAIVIIPADMPLLGMAHIDAVIDAFDPTAGRQICRAVDDRGQPGHPVLFGRRLFGALSRLDGDRGARRVIDEHPEFVAEVPTPGKGATVDLDTRADWARFRRDD